jgi:hypothetical protein
MHFYQRNGRVAMRSESPIKALAFEHFKINITSKELDKLEANIETEVKDGNLSFVENQKIAKEPLDVEELKKIIKAAKDVSELKDVLNKILDNL